MVKPITPDEVAGAKVKYLPPEVFEAFNETIAKHWDGDDATFTQDEVLSLIMSKLDISRGDVFAKKYLDVEPAYEASGWSIYYDKPGYNESYDATFKFSRR